MRLLNAYLAFRGKHMSPITSVNPTEPTVSHKPVHNGQPVVPGVQSYQGVRFAAVVPGGQWVSALSSSVRGVGTWVKRTWGSGVRGVRQLVAGVHGLLRPASGVGSRSIAMVVAADGTPVFDDNDRPGNDSSDHNGVLFGLMI